MRKQGRDMIVILQKSCGLGNRGRKRRSHIEDEIEDKASINQNLFSKSHKIERTAENRRGNRMGKKCEVKGVTEKAQSK